MSVRRSLEQETERRPSGAELGRGGHRALEACVGTCWGHGGQGGWDAVGRGHGTLCRAKEGGWRHGSWDPLSGGRARDTCRV